MSALCVTMPNPVTPDTTAPAIPVFPIATAAANVRVSVGGSVVLNSNNAIPVSYGVTPRYQWQYQTVADKAAYGQLWHHIPGANASTYEIINVTADMTLRKYSAHSRVRILI